MKDDQELTPLESLFQEQLPVLESGPAPAAAPDEEKPFETQEPRQTQPASDDEEPVGEQEASAVMETDENRPNEDKPYEELVRELEQIVRRLESGDITLDQSMALFARGIELTRRCQNQLDAIEKKIMVLIEGPDGSLEEKPFAENGND